MKTKTIMILVVGPLAAGALFLAACQKAPEPGEGDSQGPAVAPATEGGAPAGEKIEYWTCSMHPQVKEPKPGNCPFCGMELVPVYSKTETSPGGAAAPGPGAPVAFNEAEVRQVGVRTEKAQMRKLAKDLLIFGTLGYDYNRHRDVVPLVSGRIDKQFINFNQTEVRKGDPLVQLYSPEAIALQEEYLKALRDRWLSTFYERELMSSAVRLAREKLLRIGIPEQAVDRLAEDKNPSGNVVVRAPISGSLVENMVKLGEYVKADQALYHLVPLDELWFNAQVFEPDIGLLKLGQTVRISTKSFPGREFPGRLVFIGRSLDTASRTVPVRFSVPNRERKLLPNLSASGALEIPLGEALTVPNSSVLDLGTRHLVYVQTQPGIYSPREVRIGQITRHYTQILEGLSEGEEAVTAGAFLIDAQRQLSAGSAVGHDHGAMEAPVAPPPERRQEGGHQH